MPRLTKRKDKFKGRKNPFTYHTSVPLFSNYHGLNKFYILKLKFDPIYYIVNLKNKIKHPKNIRLNTTIEYIFEKILVFDKSDDEFTSVQGEMILNTDEIAKVYGPFDEIALAFELARNIK